MEQRDPLDQLLNASPGPELGESAPLREMIAVERAVRLSNGRTVHVRIVRPVDAAPWSAEDEHALRSILDVAAACTASAAAPPAAPRLLS